MTFSLIPFWVAIATSTFLWKLAYHDPGRCRRTTIPGNQGPLIYSLHHRHQILREKKKKLDRSMKKIFFPAQYSQLYS